MISIETYKPRHLYRYRSLKDARWKREIDAINNRELHFSKFTSLNDPMEGSYSANPRVRKLTKYQQIKSQIYDGKLNLGICSFSETNNNGPMWAHYADEFRGICVEYDLRKMLLADVGNQGTTSLTRITYSEDRYELTLKASSQDDIARQILSFKSHHWLHEREWRLFRQHVGTAPLSQNCVSAVFTGNRMDDVNIQKLKNDMAAVGIPIHAMKLNGYSIKFDKLK